MTPAERNSTYSTFQQKEPHFRKNVVVSAEMLNLLNSGGGGVLN